MAKLFQLLNEMPPNYRVVLWRRIIFTWFIELPVQYTTLYLTTLGADISQIGFLMTMAGLINASVSLPLGWMADQYSLRRLLFIGMIFQATGSLTYALALSWLGAIPAIFLSSTSLVIVWTIERLIVANSLGDSTRATGFSLINLFPRIPAMAAPLAAAYIVTTFGGISAQSIRVLYYVQLVGLSVQYPIVYLRLRESGVGRGNARISTLRGLSEGFRTLFEGGGKLKRWLVITSIQTTVFSITDTFAMVYAVEIKGAQPYTLAGMGLAFMGIWALSAVPLGLLADAVGRKPMLFMQRLTLHASTLLLALATAPELLILAWALRGIEFGSMVWTTMAMEMVSVEQRGKWSGMLMLVSSVSSVPAPALAGLMWTAFTPSLPFILISMMGLLVELPIILTLSETLKR